MPSTTRRYQEYLLESLKDPSEAALYLWAILQEENPEPELLKSALCDVAEALGELNLSPAQAKLHREQLEKLMNKKASEVIYGLSNWLKALGLKLTVVVDESPEERGDQTAGSSEVTVLHNSDRLH